MRASLRSLERLRIVRLLLVRNSYFEKCGCINEQRSRVSTNTLAMNMNTGCINIYIYAFPRIPRNHSANKFKYYGGKPKKSSAKPASMTSVSN